VHFSLFIMLSISVYRSSALAQTFPALISRMAQMFGCPQTRTLLLGRFPSLQDPYYVLAVTHDRHRPGWLRPTQVSLAGAAISCTSSIRS